MIIFNNMKNLQEIKRVKLNDNLDNEVRKIVDVFFDKTKRKINKKTLIGFLVIRMDDGSYGSVRVYIDPFLKAKYGFEVYGEMDTIKFDKNKLWISLDPILNTDRTQVYNTLYHEFLHVTDPVLSSKATEKYSKTYDETSDDKYYGHPIELRAMSGEFLNALVNEFKKRKDKVRDKNDIKYLKKSVNNILNHFATGEELSSLSINVLNSMWEEKNNLLNKITIDYPGVADFSKPSSDPIEYFDRYLSNIKKYSERSLWNKFLSMLYTTHEEVMTILSEE
jgi:hypothetical protein